VIGCGCKSTPHSPRQPRAMGISGNKSSLSRAYMCGWIEVRMLREFENGIRSLSVEG
jgi:hypothetical protein